MKFTILIADDEKNIREGLATSLELDGYNVISAENGEIALDLMKKNNIDLVITDLRMPRLTGEELLSHIVSSWPTIPVIVFTGHGSIETAVEAMRKGAFDFLTKPVNLDRLTLLVQRALSNRQMLMHQKDLEAELDRLRGKNDYFSMIGKSPQMKKVMDAIEQVAQTKASVLITGESGVGKELVANAIHSLSNRRTHPFIKTNCAALSESLLESELFGHEKGAYTGAISSRKGRFELADGGTIFLDEIGEINQSVQVKILRVLQEKSFERVGGEETINVDVRIISATNKNLNQEIKNGNFREDLFYRLNVVNIDVPPLRERREDILLLATSFMKEFVKENQKNIEGFDKEALLALYHYEWPGNIRELRNCVENCVVMSKGPVISIDDLPPSIKKNRDYKELVLEPGLTLEEVEKKYILSTLDKNKGNKSKSAIELGIGRKTLHRKLNEYGINSDEDSDN